MSSLNQINLSPAPVLSVNVTIPSNTVINRYLSNINYTWTFSDAVTGLDSSDFVVSNGTINSVTGSGKNWLVNVSPASNVSGTLGLNLKAGAVLDSLGIPNPTSIPTTIAMNTLPIVAPKLVTGANFYTLVQPQVTLQTTLGQIVVELNPSQAPVTVANMLAYVNDGFYDGLLFHRVIPGFMAQGGGFSSGLNTKTPTYAGIALESANGLTNLRGTIAMARTNDPNSATSQFFINQADNAFLNGKTPGVDGYAVFGKVLTGLNLIDAMVGVPTKTVGGYENVPVNEIVINSLKQTVAGSAITNKAIFNLSDLETGASWSYSLDAGLHWISGSGTTLQIPEGTYLPGAIEVRQTDLAGNLSKSVGLYTSALTVESKAPSVVNLQINPLVNSPKPIYTVKLEFNEAVRAGVGTVSLKDLQGNLIAQYDVKNAAQVSFSSASLSVQANLDVTLANGYKLEWSAGSIVDLAGNNLQSKNLQISAAAMSTISGTAADDLIAPGNGSAAIDGAAGSDTVTYSGSLASYSISKSAATPASVANYTVTPKLTGDGTSSLKNVETLRFSDVSVNLGIQDQAHAAPAQNVTKLMELYVAFFNRTPDADGLSYWIKSMSAGQSLTNIAESFYSAGVEFSSLTGFTKDMSNTAFVNLIYKNVLGRADGGDAQGVAYWSGELASGKANHGSLVFSMLNSAHTFKNTASEYAWVADLLDNKITVAKTVAVDWGITYNTPEASITQGMAIAGAVTATDTSAALKLVGISASDILLG